jgi:kynurenine formamidase
MSALPTNWGRWGPDDERGTLNLVTPEVRARAVAEARTGRTVSLARPIPTSPLVAGPTAPVGAASTAALQVGMFTGADPFAMAELVVLMTHSPESTHLDAPVHQVVDGLVYPGKPLAAAGGPAGFTHGSTAIFAEGITTRGVFLDLAPGGALPAGHGVTGDDLSAAADRAGAEVLPGDAVVVRGGRTSAGMSLDAVRWMHRHDVAVYAGDIHDVHPALDPAVPSPLHRVGLARLGLALVDVADPTALVAACAEEGRATFLFVAAPPRLQAASGVPVNPLAIF